MASAEPEDPPPATSKHSRPHRLGALNRSYVNGQLQAEIALPFKPQGAGRASIGAKMNRVSYFNGAVREARFTHAPLQPVEFSLP